MWRTECNFLSATRVEGREGGLTDLFAQRAEHLLDADELHTRPAVRLRAAGPGLVDRLPVLEADEAHVALGEQLLDGGWLGALGVEQRLADDVLEQVPDGLQRAFLVGSDHAGGAALDPAGRVVADLVAGIVRVEHAAAL